MLQAELRTYTAPLDDLMHFVESFEAIIGELAEEVHNDIEPQALAELGYYPGPSQHRGRWSNTPDANTRARRYYWWAVHAGVINADPDTGAYIRSGQYGEAWYVAFEATAGVFAFRIGTTYPGAIYVGGSLNQRTPGAAARWQNPGHAATGWPIQVQTINFWLDAALDQFTVKFYERLGEFGTLGRTTRGSQR